MRKISDTVHMIFTESGFSSSNCVFIDDQIKTVIDSGAGMALKEIDPPSVELLINSHHHIDHISGNHLFTGAMIKAHELEHRAMNNPYKLTALDEWHELMPGHDLKDPIGVIAAHVPRVVEEWPVHEYLGEGDIIDTGRTSVHVLRTPGHTEGHCSFHFPGQDFIFTGDLCLTDAGPWYGDPDTSIDDFTGSVERIIEMKPAVLATGHLMEVLTSGIRERLEEYRDRIYRREERILEYISSRAADIDEISSMHFIYRDHPNPFVEFWEKAMIKRHLERLIDHGVIEETEDSLYVRKGI